MSKWYEEVRLGSRPLEEIGAAFYIREMLGNWCLVNKWDLKAVFGDGYADMLGRLRRAGILDVEAVGSQLRLAIVAPGDKKRQRCKKLTQANRAVAKFEKRIARGGETSPQAAKRRTPQAAKCGTARGATPSHKKKKAAPCMARSGTGEVRPTRVQEVSFV